jgi:hypothetical protein
MTAEHDIPIRIAQQLSILPKRPMDAERLRQMLSLRVKDFLER